MSSFDDKSKGFEKKLSNKAISFFVKQLGDSVTKQSVKMFRVGYDAEKKAFTNPEFDGVGHVVGITRRLNKGKGKKKAIHGSKRGMAIPTDFADLDHDGPILIPEGLTDSMAFHGAGCAVVGRPSATGGTKYLTQFLDDFFDREVIVVGDNDQKKDGKWPGKEGAVKTAKGLASSLDRAITVAFPPSQHKDCRDWLNDAPELDRHEVIEFLQINSSTVEPEDEAVADAPQSPVDIFSNYRLEEIENSKPKRVGLMSKEIFTRLQAITGGNLRSLNNKALFVAEGDDKVRLIVNHEQFFAWLDGVCKVDWASGADKVSEKRFFLYCLQECQAFESVELFPHFPDLDGAFYHHPELSEEESEPTKLDQLLAMLSPYSCDDEALIKALIVTVLWGGDAGSRPVFLITGPPGDPGRGVGKSFLARVVSELCGGLMDFNPSENIAKIKTRLLSEGAIGKRVALIDNIKTSKFSWGEFEGMVTAPVISGHQLYVGETQRPNHLTWILTVNGASVSQDIAQRTVVIKLNRPEYNPEWQPNILSFIEGHRLEIIADVKRIIEQEETHEE